MDDINQESTEGSGQEYSSPESTENNSQNQNSQTDSNVADQIADLGRFQRVSWKGKEIPVNDLVSGWQRQSSLQKEIQTFKEQEKYVSNLQADLTKVLSNPALADTFKKVYPEKFHWILEETLKGRSPNMQSQPGSAERQQTQNGQPPNDNLDPRVAKAISKIEQFETDRFEEKVQTRQAEIDSAFSKFQAKYPLATPNGDESYVLARAQSMVEGGSRLSEKEWEKLFADAHKHFEKAYESFYKTRNNNQLAANARGKESARGGGIPGSAPNSPKTIKDATKIALQDLTQQR